jgi:hypothetical protein
MFRLWMARRGGGGGGGESQDQLEVAAFIQQGREKTRMSSHILTVWNKNVQALFKVQSHKIMLRQPLHFSL